MRGLSYFFRVFNLKESKPQANKSQTSIYLLVVFEVESVCTAAKIKVQLKRIK